MAAVTPDPRSAALPKGLLGGIVGNALEWYDFAVFGYFAPTIGRAFFPATSPTASLFGAFGVFAAAYVMRPFGGMFFGYLGDRLGRKPALQLSVMMMAVPTFTIGLLPAHATIGIAAAVLLTLLRLLQGVSVGGELVGSIAFITETAPRSRRGFLGSWALASSTAGVALGSLVALLVEQALSPAEFQSWGWRVPFLAGGVIAISALWMRSNLEETPVFEEMNRANSKQLNPLLEAVRTAPRRVVHLAALVALCGGGFYLLFVWWPTFLGKLHQPAVPHALVTNTLSMLVLMAVIPAAGALSDLTSRRHVLLLSASGIIVFAYPLFLLVDHGTFPAALVAQLTFAILMGGFTGPIPATMVELFPAPIRFSGMAIGYNLSLCIFGGTAPLVATWLYLRTKSVGGPATFLVFLALASLIAVLYLPRNRKQLTSLEREKLRCRVEQLEHRLKFSASVANPALENSKDIEGISSAS